MCDFETVYEQQGITFVRIIFTITSETMLSSCFSKVVLTLIRCYMFAQLCISQFNVNYLPKEKKQKLVWLQYCCCHGNSIIEVHDYNTNKCNTSCELTHRTQRWLWKAETVRAFCCFHRVTPDWKLFQFKPIIPLDSSAQGRLQYFASHNGQWNGPSLFFFFTLAFKSSGRAASMSSAHSAAHSDASLTQH